MKKWMIFFFSLLFTMRAFANDLPVGDIDSQPIQIELISEEETIQPGRPFWVAIQLKTEEGWHAYWKNPGETGAPAAVQWNLPPGYKIGETEWPFPQRFDLNSIIGFGYEGSFWLLTPITPPLDLAQDKPVEIAANVEWLVCSDANCVPGETSVKLSLPVHASAPKKVDQHQSKFAKARSKLPKKQWHIQVQRKDDLILLHLESPNQQTYSKAEFFPENNEAVDSKFEPLWETQESSRRYTLTLKENEKQLGKKSLLQGVLVLHSGADKAEAVEVKVPLPPKQVEGADEVATLSDDEKVLTENPADEVSSVQDDVQFEGGVGLALLFAFVGGMILNLMPCVLPVVSFKILSFVKMARESRFIILKHGLAFSFGVILSFWVLAILLLGLQAYGQSVGWGFQLQEPLFVAALAGLLLVFGFSLFGVFEMGTSLTAMAASSSSSTSGLTGSFFSGVLATVVATPCTGPFLGTAIGFAVTLPALQSLLIFTSLGLGMSLPYLLLAAFPALLRFLPKPGNWMVTFKEIMGFLMVGTAIWLVWVFSAQTNHLAVVLLLCGFFVLGIGCWILGKWGTPICSRLVRRIAFAIAILNFGVGGFIIYNSTLPWVMVYGGETASSSKASGWEVYSEERVADLQKQGIPVFVDFTAKWCLICQANHYILTTDSVSKKFDELGVVKMKADWTKKDDSITRALRKFGRNGVPLYVLYGSDPSTQPVILPQVLTSEIVIDHLEKVKGREANIAKD